MEIKNGIPVSPGVAIAPAQLVAQDVAEGRLAAPWGYADAGGRWVLCAPRRGSDERLQAFAAWLGKELGDRPLTRAEERPRTG